MTLFQVLEINAGFLSPEHDDALAIAERLFEAAGAPTKKDPLCRILERIVAACQRRNKLDGLRYPPILLKRLKQLERGTWAPNRQPAAEPAARAASALPPNSGTPEGARQMIRDLKKVKAPAELIKEWEQKLELLESAATKEPSEPLARPGPQLVPKKKTA